ncbi:MAG TPA: ribose-phosphate pyrophosphokinase-like domain-containing protein, partial [Gammaproteobacteria bacterium]|nr:ribose-phosphate pyrophosphokinase-like domain-containing protein [Gammaproteobacteria bacterium]
MDVTVISFGNEAISEGIAKRLDIVHTTAEVHRFPDGECRVRIEPACAGKRVIIACSLHLPDQAIIPLLFLTETLRDYGTERIYLVAPYLAYMRQDIRFHEGDGISARYFARLLSGYCDTLITVDPHLHRINSLDEIYTIPAYVVHAAPVVAGWIHDNISHP